MYSKKITKNQAILYMKNRREGNLQELSAAKAGFSVRSGREIEKGRHHTCHPPKIRTYKTRTSKIDEVWVKELEPMLAQNPELQPKTLLIYLKERYNKNSLVYSKKNLRTLQRRVSSWKAINGPDKEVMFPQKHKPGKQSLSDFTRLKGVTILINGKPFNHLLYQFRLVFSKWVHLRVIPGKGESMQALSEGLQSALFVLGGSTFEHRTDSLSAAFKNLSPNAKKDLTSAYEDLCKYYNMVPTRNNKGKKHENGSIESSHGHIKNRIKQALILRGSHDFSSIKEYESWLSAIVDAHNEDNCVDFESECEKLQKLPKNPYPYFSSKSFKVSSLSIINIDRVKYSVPSRLIGHTITVHIYLNEIKIYHGNTLVCKKQKQHFIESSSDNYVIDHRDIISSLVKKPNAFLSCKYQKSIFPNEDFQKIWEYLEVKKEKPIACKIMVRLLKISADNHCEEKLGEYVLSCISANKPLDLGAIERKFSKNKINISQLPPSQHDLQAYDKLLHGTTTI